MFLYWWMKIWQDCILLLHPCIFVFRYQSGLFFGYFLCSLSSNALKADIIFYSYFRNSDIFNIMLLSEDNNGIKIWFWIIELIKFTVEVFQFRTNKRTPLPLLKFSSQFRNIFQRMSSESVFCKILCILYLCWDIWFY